MADKMKLSSCPFEPASLTYKGRKETQKTVAPPIVTLTIQISDAKKMNQVSEFIGNASGENVKVRLKAEEGQETFDDFEGFARITGGSIKTDGEGDSRWEIPIVIASHETERTVPLMKWRAQYDAASCRSAKATLEVWQRPLPFDDTPRQIEEEA